METLPKEEVAGQLHAYQHKAGRHQGDVRGSGVSPETPGAAPVGHRDENGAQREQLAELHADIEGDQVRNQLLAALVFGWNPNQALNAPRLSSAL